MSIRPSVSFQFGQAMYLMFYFQQPAPTAIWQITLL